MEIHGDSRASAWLVNKGEMMELHTKVASIASKSDLTTFINELAADLEANPQRWENSTLDRYLRALASWVDDSDGFYTNQGRAVPVNPSWRDVAEMLMAASMYE